MIILFDVDGTLVDGEHLDWDCFRSAFQGVLGTHIAKNFVSSEFEVTAPSLVRRLCVQIGCEPDTAVENAILNTYVERLAVAHATARQPIRAFPGARQLLKMLETQTEIRVGIISGDWREAVLFKARAAKLELDRFPLRTASHYPKRRDIISSLMVEMGAEPDSTIYVGDGVWDLRTAQELGLKFVGVGYRREQLRIFGADWILNDMKAATWRRFLLKISWSGSSRRLFAAAG